MADIDKLAAELGKLTLKEAAELSRRLSEEWGVSMAPVIANIWVPEDELELEQTEFNVVLRQIGPKKIEVIKAVRMFTGLGLRAAKTLVETADAIIEEAVDYTRACIVQEKLESAGAVVEVL